MKKIRKGRNVKVLISGKFGKVQREIIRVAVIVAAANFPLPSKIKIGKMTGAQKKEHGAVGVCWGKYILLDGSQRDGDLFKTISHELKHSSDYYQGILGYKGEDFSWYGRRVPAKTKWENQPHERVAIKYENRLIP